MYAQTFRISRAVRGCAVALSTIKTLGVRASFGSWTGLPLARCATDLYLTTIQLARSLYFLLHPLTARRATTTACLTRTTPPSPPFLSAALSLFARLLLPRRPPHHFTACTLVAVRRVHFWLEGGP